MKKVIKTFAILVLAFSVFIGTGAIVGSAKTETAYAVVYTRGSTGATVKTIQQKLKRWGYYTGAVDGIYGSKTVEAVKYFQRKNDNC